MEAFKMAEKGKQFVLTQKGYDRTPEHIKHERAVGKPVHNYKEYAPVRWVEKGWVKEVEKERER